MSHSDPPDYYEALEVSPNARPAVIEAAWRRLNQEYHPDHHPDDPAALDRLKLINAAHDVLRDPEQRRTYDARRQSAQAGRTSQSRQDSAPRPPTTPPPRPAQTGQQSAGGQQAATAASSSTGPRPGSSPRPESYQTSQPSRAGVPWSKLAAAGVAVVIVAIVASNLTHSSSPGDNGYNPTAATTLTVAPTSVASAAFLYQADWSTGLGGWTGRSDWKTVDGMLVDDGTGPHNWQLSVTAPYTPSTPDYAIEADIQVINVGGCSSFGLVARATDSAPGNQGGINYCEFRGANLWDVAGANTDYDPGSGWHTYRLEVQANEIRFFVDGVLMVSGMDNQYVAPGKVGLWCDQMQINVRSFRVLNLGTTPTATPS